MDNCYRVTQHSTLRVSVFATTCHTVNCTNPRHIIPRMTATPSSPADKGLGHVHLPPGDTKDCWGWSGPMNFSGGPPEAYVASKAFGLRERPKGCRPVKTCQNQFCCNPRHLRGKHIHPQAEQLPYIDGFLEEIRRLRQEVVAFQSSGEKHTIRKLHPIPTLSQPASAEDVFLRDPSRTLFLRLICNTAKLHHPECAAELDAIRDRNHEVAGLCLVHRHKLVVACATAACHHTPDPLTFTFITPEDIRREFP